MLPYAVRPESWKNKTAPAAEPISRTEAKLHLRVDVTDDDTLIDNLIVAARSHAENVLNRALITQTWTAYFQRWPCYAFELPLASPLQSVTHVKYTTDLGATSTLSASVYNVDTAAYVGRVWLADNQDWPIDALRNYNPIEIEYVVGFGTAGTSIPKPIIQAMLLHIGHMYENREAVTSESRVQQRELPFAYDALLNPYRVRTI